MIVGRRRVGAGKAVARADQGDGAGNDGAEQRQEDDGLVHAANSLELGHARRKTAMHSSPSPQRGEGGVRGYGLSVRAPSPQPSPLWGEGVRIGKPLTRHPFIKFMSSTAIEPRLRK